MNHAERKRLEAAGWQVGSVADFLGLTDEETVYIELRVRLAEALKARRRAAKLSQKAFATAMKSSQSRIAKAEANNHSVSLDLLIRSLIALGVSLSEMGRIVGVDEDNQNLNAATTNAHGKTKTAGTTRPQLRRKHAKQSRKKDKRSSARAAR